MNIFFSWKEIKSQGVGLTFDDVLIVPVRSNVTSRRDPVLRSRLTKKVEINIPIISANMDTVTDSDMAIEMQSQGAFGIVHRFLTIEKQVQHVVRIKEAGFSITAAGIGVGAEEKERARRLVTTGVSILVIDIAHGHSQAAVNMLKWIKDSFPNVEVIVGNIVTPEAVMELAEEGADAIKVGIGPGSLCTTRIVTGCGVPQLTAIALCAEASEEKGIPIIADGGIRTSGDIVKAFAAGASTVMVGSLVAATIEAPGSIIKGQKKYQGMASKDAQVSWKGGVPEGMAPEGEAIMLPVKGHVKDVIVELTGGICSAMSYLNALHIKGIREKARFIRISYSSVIESYAHGLYRVN